MNLHYGETFFFERAFKKGKFRNSVFSGKVIKSLKWPGIKQNADALRK